MTPDFTLPEKTPPVVYSLSFIETLIIIREALGLSLSETKHLVEKNREYLLYENSPYLYSLKNVGTFIRLYYNIKA